MEIFARIIGEGGGAERERQREREREGWWWWGWLGSAFGPPTSILASVKVVV